MRPKMTIEKHNGNADALSRKRQGSIEPIQAESTPLTTVTFLSFTKDDMSKWQRADATIGRVWSFWDIGTIPTVRQLMKEYKSIRKALREWKRRVLYRIVMINGNRVKQVMLKGKGMVLYSAVSSPLDRSKRFTLVAFPDRPVHSDTVLCFSWKHSSHAAIAQRLFTHISTTVYSQVHLIPSFLRLPDNLKSQVMNAVHGRDTRLWRKHWPLCVLGVSLLLYMPMLSHIANRARDVCCQRCGGSLIIPWLNRAERTLYGWDGPGRKRKPFGGIDRAIR